GRLQILIAAAYRAVDKDKIGNLLPNEAIEVAARVSKLLKAFHAEVERVWKPEPGERDPLWRAANGKLPPQWGPAIEELGEETRALFNWVHAAHSAIAKGKQDDS
ncbi:MAG: ATP-dependent DNA helicase DinG, partial [Xanthomonas perforans]|nr:ATP-dependent DNA helicase DinG [Xanthomonas perforans]